MQRRRFLGLLAGATAGAVFVPKYERWFRPNRIVPPPSPWTAWAEWSQDGHLWTPIPGSARPLDGRGSVSIQMPPTTSDTGEMYVRMRLGSPSGGDWTQQLPALPLGGRVSFNYTMSGESLWSDALYAGEPNA